MSYAPRIAASYAQQQCSRKCMELCTNGRTDGLTEKHLLLRNQSSGPYRARAYGDHDDLVGFASLAADTP